MNKIKAALSSECQQKTDQAEEKEYITQRKVI
jgi:hypothetical protein